MAVLYGPVPSWRLGRSLGIDLRRRRPAEGHPRAVEMEVS